MKLRLVHAMVRLDAGVIDRLTVVSHAVQRLTGHPNYRQAMWCGLVWVFSLALTVADYWLPALIAADTSGVDLTVALINLFIAQDFTNTCRQLDREYTGDSLPIRAIGHVLFDATAVIRVIAIVVIVVLVTPIVAVHVLTGEFLSAFAGTGVVFFTLGLHLLAVVPLPRAPSKIQEWLESFSAAPLRGAHVES